MGPTSGPTEMPTPSPTESPTLKPADTSDTCYEYNSVKRCSTWKKPVQMGCYWELESDSCQTWTGEGEPVDPCSILTDLSCLTSRRGMQWKCILTSEDECATDGWSTREFGTPAPIAETEF